MSLRHLLSSGREALDSTVGGKNNNISCSYPDGLNANKLPRVFIMASADISEIKRCPLGWKILP